jgi:ATP-binding cassette, subfamily B, bacterial MsbA
MDRVYPATQYQNINIKKSEQEESSCEIHFENVSFSYTSDTPVLKNITLTLKSSERVGIIGPSGAGKSTFCDLLLGFITPTSGQILINGQDISQISLAELRNKIGYVGQKTFLFNDTVYANVAYCQQNKTEIDVINSCKAAHADEFIQKLPQKYQTNVGENGNMLSGGQKQRITIARAILKNSPILIFDEATSALDHESENMIRLTLEENLKEKTVIVVSHRLSFIEKMDRIFIVKNHQIEEISKNYLKDQIVRDEI